MTESIYKYWFENIDSNVYKRWIPINNSDKKESIDNVSKFRSYLYEKLEYLTTSTHEDLVKHYKSLINNSLESFREFLVDFIVIDQFLRTLIPSNLDLLNKKEGVTVCLGNIIIDINEKILDNLLANKMKIHGYEMIFILMPLKHNLVYKSINRDTIMDICCKFNEIYYKCEYYAKFYGDLCKKYYTLRDVIPKLDNTNYKKTDMLNYKIFEYLDETFFEKDLTKHILCSLDMIILEYIKDHLHIDSNICVSLSGGIDSMVMMYSLFKLKHMGFISNTISCIHIEYGNRDESSKEREFIKIYTEQLFIDMYTYNIKYLKRCMSNRALYESITRDIRYDCYRNIANEKGVILLGHIKDDVIENIITNFSTNKHISNLKKFSDLENIEGVMIGRPLLNTLKDAIYKYSKQHKIPYLLNTTPDWSNRGKFRNKFVHAFENQYGSQGLDLVIRSAEDINSMSNLVNSMIIKPLLDKLMETNNILLNEELINNRYIIYTLFEKYFHSKGLSKASKKSINNIVDNIPCNRLFKLKKTHDVYVDNYNITINQVVI